MPRIELTLRTRRPGRTNLRGIHVVALLIATALTSSTMSSCGVAAERSNPSAAPASSGFTSLAVKPADVDSGASEEQRAAVADGVVTFEEYENAVLRTVACLREAGYRITGWPSREAAAPPVGPVLTKRGQYQYLADTGGEEGGDVSEKLAACSRHSDVLERLWSAHVAPSEQELQQARDAIGACLSKHGVKVSEHPGASELLGIGFPPDGIITAPPPQPYLGCAERAANEVGIPGRYYGQ